MTDTLIAVGLIVFFLSVYGAVMVGGHLLEQAQDDDDFGPKSLAPDIRDADVPITPHLDRHQSTDEPRSLRRSVDEEIVATTPGQIVPGAM